MHIARMKPNSFFNKCPTKVKENLQLKLYTGAKKYKSHFSKIRLSTEQDLFLVHMQQKGGKVFTIGYYTY